MLAVLFAIATVGVVIAMRQNGQRRESTGLAIAARPLWLKLALALVLGSVAWVAGNVFVRGVVSLLR